MTSTSIYTTIPYFYIIQHKVTKKLYAGSKWAKGCHPNEFMQPNGYTTSSPTINEIIEQEGLNSFEIIRIDTNLDGLSAYNYESLFLQTIDCAGSIDWYNGHNNTGILALGTISFTLSMMTKYGVTNANYSVYIQNARKENCNAKHGVDYYFQSEEFKNKSKETNIERYGVDHAAKLETTQYKRLETNLEKYGVEHIMTLDEFKDKAINTSMERFGFEYAMQSPKVKQKSVSTCLEKYGVEYALQSLEVRNKSKQYYMDNYGVDHNSKVKFLSIIETKKSYAKNQISRRYPEFKQYY